MSLLLNDESKNESLTNGTWQRLKAVLRHVDVRQIDQVSKFVR